MVASDHELASLSGAEVLRNGGNAVDAAVATALAAGVVQPAGSGLGGGGFALVTEPGKDPYILDFREVAPGGSSESMYRDEQGQVINGLSRVGGLAVGVPGESRGLARLLAERGTKSSREVAAPAIRLASRGFEVGSHLVSALSRTQHGEVIGLFQRDGKMPTFGDHLKRPGLARSLQSWASSRGEDLYVGAGAHEIVRASRRTGGVLAPEDLANYTPVQREPVLLNYRGLQVITMPPPSSGGLVLGQMLRVLEGYELSEMGHNSADYLHLIAEVMKHAFADRAHHMGDPGFVDVPTERLLSDERVSEIRSRVWPGRTFKADYYGTLIAPPADAGTQHISVVDKDGMAVALTTTINTSFGSGVVVRGLGLILNNEMDDFAAAPGVPNAFGLVGNAANAVAPGKRPLSSMSPTIVLDSDGEVLLAVGASGGSTIISSVLQTIVNTVDFGMDPVAAVSAPRIHHQWQPDVLMLEPEIPVDVVNALRARGHEIVVREGFSSVQAVLRDQASLAGASDPRKGGRAAGVW